MRKLFDLPIFGPAGNSESFKTQGYKNNIQVPEYLKNMGLNSYEYQCGRGVKISKESANDFGKEAKDKGVTLSLHAPYYISISSAEEEKRIKSADYILQSATAADNMGAERIIVHSGSCAKMSREEALSLAKDTLLLSLKTLEDNKLGHINICPETMGKINQLGTFEEVVELCKLDERLIPCIDFGHLYARSLGKDHGEDFYKYCFDILQNDLGEYRYKNFHVHFSKIQFTENGGEKKHIKFSDNEFGPDYKPFIQQIFKRNLTPRIICESDGTQAEDSLEMKNYYNSLK